LTDKIRIMMTTN